MLDCCARLHSLGERRDAYAGRLRLAEQWHLSKHLGFKRGAELTKDALQVIAAAAPKSVASNEVVKALTGMGYKATDQTKEAVINALDSIDEATGGSVLKRVEDASRSIVYEMNATIARQILKAMKNSAKG